MFNLHFLGGEKMKRLSNSNYLHTYLLVIFLISIPISIFSASDTLLDPNQRYVPAQLLIQLAGPIGGGFEKWRGGSKDEIVQTGFPEVDALNEQYGVYMAELAWGDDATGSVPETLDNCYVFYFLDEELDMEEIAGEYKEAEGCLEAEPNYFRWGIPIRWPSALKSESNNFSVDSIKPRNLSKLIPDDYNFQDQWYFDDENDHDIDAPEAWYEIMLVYIGPPTYLWHNVKISQLDTHAWRGNINGALLDETNDYDFVDSDDDPWWDYNYPDTYEWHADITLGMYLTWTDDGPFPQSRIASTNWTGLVYPYYDELPTYISLMRVLQKESFIWEGQEYWTNKGNIRNCVSGMVRSANKNMNIVFMPYGGYDYSAFEDKAAEWLRDANHDALLVAPAGFAPPFVPKPIPVTKIYPAELEEVMAIGALDHDNNPTDDTNQDITIDLWSYGKDCVALWADEVRFDNQGPAFASSLVVGVAASYMARYGEGGGDTAKSLIKYSDTSGLIKRLNYLKSFAKSFYEPPPLSSSFLEETKNITSIVLRQNYPNPVLDSTTIPVELNGDTSKNVDLRIYDISGRLVKCFNEVLEPGVNSIIWDAKDDNGSFVSSGVYILKIESEGCISSLKMVVDR
jgi:hypothetical protein